MDPPDLEFKDRAQWRGWLHENHSGETEAWAVIYKKGSELEGLRYLEAVEEALCYGWIDSKMQSVDGDRFRQRFSPRRRDSPWSKANRETAERLIEAGLMAEAGHKAIEEAKRNGRWDRAYTSKVAPEVPEDLMAALRGNPSAKKNFDAFSNSAKLMYVYWVESAKRDETRARRIAEVVDKAAQNIKPG